MPLPSEVSLALAAFLGHFSLAVWLYNRLHAIGLPTRLMNWLERLLVATAAIVLLAWIVRMVWIGRFINEWSLADPWTVYALVCWPVAALLLPLWLWPKLTERAPAALVSNDTQIIDVVERVGA